MENITPEQFNRDLKANDPQSVFIDVRTTQEFNHKKIPGVINVPLNELSQRIPELQKYQKIYLHCEVGSRSEYACMILDQMGFSKTYNLIGGIFGWERSGFPVIK